MSSFEDNTARVLGAVRQSGQGALRDAGRTLLRKSNEKSPTLSGEMDATGFVEVDDTTATVGYTSEYVRKQHENVYYRHPQGDEPKFLERAMDENRSELIRALAAGIRSALT